MNQLNAIKSIFSKYPVASGTVCLLCVLAVAFILRHGKASDLQATLASKTDEARRQSLNIARHAQLDEQLTTLEEANREIGSRLVNPQDLATNLQYFYKLEAETGVKLLDTHPAGSNSGKQQPFKAGYRTVQYGMTLEGSFNQVLVFLRRLEQGTIYCRIISAECAAKQEEPTEKKDQGTVNLSLTIEILGKA
jgi:hypothetical protein